jgi:hypothetical protein
MMFSGGPKVVVNGQVSCNLWHKLALKLKIELSMNKYKYNYSLFILISEEVGEKVDLHLRSVIFWYGDPMAQLGANFRKKMK